MTVPTLHWTEEEDLIIRVGEDPLSVDPRLAGAETLSVLSLVATAEDPGRDTDQIVEIPVEIKAAPMTSYDENLRL